jgi:hypothetical protein
MNEIIGNPFFLEINNVCICIKVIHAKRSLLTTFYMDVRLGLNFRLLFSSVNLCFHLLVIINHNLRYV